MADSSGIGGAPAARRRLRGFLTDALVVALAVLVGSWLVDPAHRPGASEGNDFTVFYEGAAGFGPTGNPYGTGFVSPAPFALLLQPLVALPPDGAAIVWLVLSVLALVGLAAVSLHLAGLPAPRRAVLPLAAVLFFWPASNHGLLLGQSSVFIALLVALAVAIASARPAAAGALLAVGAIAKPHLVLLVALGLAADEIRRSRRRDLATAFAATALGLVLLTALYSRRWIDVLMNEPPESWNYWGSTVGSNVFLSAILEDRAAGWFLLAVLGSALVFGLAVWWWRSSPSVAQLGSALLPATLLVSPYAYPHDYVLLAPSLVWVAARYRGLAGAAALPLVVGLVVLTWFAPVPALYTDERFVALVVPATLLGLVVTVPPATPARRCDAVTQAAPGRGAALAR